MTKKTGADDFAEFRIGRVAKPSLARIRRMTGLLELDVPYGYSAPTEMSGDDGPILPSPSFAATLMESVSCMSDN